MFFIDKEYYGVSYFIRSFSQAVDEVSNGPIGPRCYARDIPQFTQPLLLLSPSGATRSTST